MKPFILLIILASALCYNPDIVVAVNESTISGLEDHFHDLIADKLNNIKIKDLTLVDNRFALLKLKENKLSFEKYSRETLTIDLKENNKFTLSIKDFEVLFKTQIESKIISQSFSSFGMHLNNLNIRAELEFKPNQVPSITMNDIEILYDLQFDSKGSFILAIFRSAYNSIDYFLHRQIEKVLSKTIRFVANVAFKRFVKHEKIQLNDRLALRMDTEPLVENEFLVLPLEMEYYLDGEMLPKEEGPKFEDLYDPKGEGVQVKVNFNQIESGLAIVQALGKMTFDVTNELIEKTGVQLTTGYLDEMFAGLVERYGEDRELFIRLDAIRDETHPIDFKITDGVLNFDIFFRIQVFVEEDAPYATTISKIGVSLDVALKKGLLLTVNIKSFKVSDTEYQVSEGGIHENANEKMFEKFLNLMGKLAIPFVNEKIKDFPVPVPAVAGVTFTDVLFMLNETNIEFQITPKYVDEKVVTFLLKPKLGN